MKKHVAHFVQRAVRGLGYEVLSSWRLSELTKSKNKYLTELFQKFDIGLVLDIGGNKGQFREFLREDVLYAGRILTFEPIPELAADLARQSRHDPNWTVFPFALGSEDGSLPLNVASSSDFSSFLTPREDEARFHQQNKTARVVEVPVRRLADVASELPVRIAEVPTFLKIDTQGFDLEVLKGAGDLLGQIPLVQTEMSVIPLYEKMPNYIETMGFLNERGFLPSSFNIINMKKRTTIVEFDAVFVNSRFATA